MKSIPKARRTDKSSAWHIWETHMEIWNWGKMSSGVFSRRHMYHFSPSRHFDPRYFLWVWSPCPTTTGSTRWTRGCAMGWASYPWQPRPCCARRGSCQRPRAAATAPHQTGAPGSSHRAPCAGVCVRVCVPNPFYIFFETLIKGVNRTLRVFLIIYNPTDWGASGRGYLWVHFYLDSWSILGVKAGFTSFVLFFPCWLVLWLACVGHYMYIMYARVVYILFFEETISSIKKKKQSRTDTYIIIQSRERIFCLFFLSSQLVWYIIVALF